MQFRYSQRMLGPATDRNNRDLQTWLDQYAVTFESDGRSLILPGDVTIGGSVIGTWRGTAAWSPSYTAITVGNGTVNARYAQVNEIVFAHFTFTLGSTSVVGTNPGVSLPVAASQYTNLRNIIGQSHFRDTSAGTNYYGTLKLDIGNTKFDIRVANTSGTYMSHSTVTPTVPFTWATGDILFFQGFYEAS